MSTSQNWCLCVCVRVRACFTLLYQKTNVRTKSSLLLLLYNVPKLKETNHFYTFYYALNKLSTSYIFNLKLYIILKLVGNLCATCSTNQALVFSHSMTARIEVCFTCTFALATWFLVSLFHPLPINLNPLFTNTAKTNKVRCPSIFTCVFQSIDVLRCALIWWFGIFDL